MRYTIREVIPSATFTAGNVITFDLQSILNEFRSWSFACIHNMAFRFNPTFNTGASGGVPRILPQTFASNILIQDVGGQRVNLQGASLHNLLKAEYGLVYEQPAATAVSQTGASLTTHYPVPILPPKARRPRDYSLPVSTFLDGGIVQITCGSATPVAGYYTVTSANISLVLKIVEEGVPELKSRFLLRDQAIAQTDFAGYIAGGFIRSAYMYNGSVNEATAAAWAAQRLDSYTFNYQQVRDTSLRHLHMLDSLSFRKDSGTPATASAIVDEDPIVTGQMVPIVWPSRNQKITDMIQASTFHVRTNLGSITTTDNPKIITSVLEERNPVASQRTLGRTDISAAIAGGRIKTANGNRKTVAQGGFGMDLVNVLPVKVETGK